MSDTPLDTVAFAEKLLALLEEGKRSSTYKFAVLLGLVDLCLEKTGPDSAPPDVVMTGDLAEKVVEIYWRQAVPYEDLQRVLEQNQGPARRRSDTVSAKIVRVVAEVRSRHPGRSLHEARVRDRDRFQRMVRTVEATLIKMPLPRLQHMGGTEESFIYRINWDEDIREGTWSGTRGFDSRVWFLEKSAQHLVRLSSLLRPLIQQKWTAMVAELNRLPIGALDEFLFGVDRKALRRVAGPLLGLQSGRCFYCQAKVDGRGEVDHFIPWSRHADNGLDNLVVADRRCNLAKRNFLAAEVHRERWLERGEQKAVELQQMADVLPWPRDKERTCATVRAFYRSAPGGVLWVRADEFATAH